MTPLSPLASQLLLWGALIIVSSLVIAYEVWRTNRQKRQRVIDEQWHADAVAWLAGRAGELRITENSTWRAYGCAHGNATGLSCPDCREHYADDEGEAHDGPDAA